MQFTSVQELIELAENSQQTIGQIVLAQQVEELGSSSEEIYQRMADKLATMRQAASEGKALTQRSPSGLSGGDANKMDAALRAGKTVGGRVLGKALVTALAVTEVNACMGRIVASPTAGACGILPASILTILEEQDLPLEKGVMGLFTAGGIGMVIASRATISGAEGGCQAECGSAAAMAAAALVEMMGGTPTQAGHACAIALKNILGSVCDPVAGLVEAPCIKRNTIGVANALVATDLALAGITSVIPVDEVIDAMGSVGQLMSAALRETAEGGLAATPTGRRIAQEVFGDR